MPDKPDYFMILVYLAFFLSTADLFTFYKVERLRNSCGIAGEQKADIIGSVNNNKPQLILKETEYYVF